MTAIVFRNKDGKPLSETITAVIVGHVMGLFGYEGEPIEVPDELVTDEGKQEEI